MKFRSGMMLILLAGCGTDHPEVARVRGKVTLNGVPFTAGGTVYFEPQGTGKRASGRIQSDGSYELSTYSAGDGAVVGAGKVAVMPPVAVTDELTESQPLQTSTSPIPRRYRSMASSELTCEVKAGVLNEFPIKMQSK